MNLHKNYIYNLIKILNEILYPLITIPYVTRVIYSQGIGEIEYINALCIYGIVLSNFGIDKSGSVKLSQEKYDIKKKNKLIINYLNFQLLTTIVGTSIFVSISYFLEINKMLLIIFSLKIFFNFFKVEWYFNALENFKYLMMRDFIVKIVCIFLILTLIKKESDILKYGLILVLGESFSNIFNFYKLIKNEKINIDKILKISYKKIFEIYQENISFCLAGFSVTLYIVLDKVMLGIISGDSYVGYYSMANRIIRISLGISLATVSILIPKLSQIYKSSNIIKFKKILKLEITYIYMLTIPMFFAINIISKDVVIIVLGPNFVSSEITLKILSYLLLIVPLANIYGLQILNITENSLEYTKSILLSGILNLILNLILIKEYNQNGAAISSIIAEISGVYYQRYIVKKKLNIDFNIFKNIKIYILSGLFMSLFLIIFNKIFPEITLGLLIIKIILGILFYFISVYLQKDTLFFRFVNKKELGKY